MTSRLVSLTFDAIDPARVARFWASALGWEIVDESGESLVHSRSFASEDDAEGAARYVYQGARSAHFELQVAKERPTVAA